ncbi:MAG: hypothetical protein KUG51_02165 [Urechidicola sp.]|nr:hypothetical protein [Urechidicola sp.]
MKKLTISKKRIFIALGFIVFVLLINQLASSFIKNKITDLLLKNESGYYTASVESVDFRLLRRTLTLTDVFIIPTKKSLDSLKNKSSSKESLENITLSSINLKGIGLIDILFNKKIDINTIVLNNLLIHKLENSKIREFKKEKKSIDIDSIYLKKLNGLGINTIVFNNFQYEVYDFAMNEVTFKTNPLSFKSSGIKLEKFNDNLFKLKPAKQKFEIKNIDLDFEDAQYDFSIGLISVNFEDKLLEIENIKLKPQTDKFKLATTYKYNTPIFDFTLDKIGIHNFSLPKLINGEGIFIDSIAINKLGLNIFKDKRKPFDETKRPGLPHTGLKRMKLPLLVKKVKVSNSSVLIENKMEDKDVLMEIPISNLNAEITNITSIKKHRGEPMKVTATANLMSTASANLNVSFPLKDYQNTFYFNGSLGKSKMEIFDSALYPVLGLKVLNGDLDNLTFSASANDTEAHGKMTMLYHNLEAEVFKSKSVNEENKFLSWTVNTLIKKENPKKNKTPREVVLHTERVNYKGLGNYFWKTLQSGIINTISGRKQTEESKKRKNHHKKK